MSSRAPRTNSLCGARALRWSGPSQSATSLRSSRLHQISALVRSGRRLQLWLSTLPCRTRARISSRSTSACSITPLIETRSARRVHSRASLQRRCSLHDPLRQFVKGSTCSSGRFPRTGLTRVHGRRLRLARGLFVSTVLYAGAFTRAPA